MGPKLFLKITGVLLFAAMTSCHPSADRNGDGASATSTSTSPGPQASPKIAVAVLDHVDGVIEIRSNQQLVWNKASEGAKLYNRDTIRSGDKSTARVYFADGSTLDVGPKTSIIVVEKADVALPSGEITGHVENTPEKLGLMIRTPRAWLKTMEAKFKASMDSSGRLRVKNEAGELHIVFKEREAKLKSGDSITLSGPAVSADIPIESMQEPPSAGDADLKIESAAKSAPKSPGFELDYPKAATTVSVGEIAVRGKIGGDTKVFLNGAEIVADKEGRFTKNVGLTVGSNLLTFQIISQKSGKVSYKTLEVTREK